MTNENWTSVGEANHFKVIPPKVISIAPRMYWLSSTSLKNTAHEMHK